MTDFRINKDEIPRIRIREEDLEDVDVEAIAQRLSEQVGERLLGDIESLFDPDFDFTTTTVQSNQEPITYESLAATMEKMKAEKKRIDVETAIRIVAKLEEFIRRDPKWEDFSFDAGDWVILPQDIFDSINVALPPGVHRALDWMEPGDFYAVRGSTFPNLPEPGELWNDRFKPRGEQR